MKEEMEELYAEALATHGDPEPCAAHRAAAPCQRERLVMAYWDLSPEAAPGVDGVTRDADGRELVARLRDLHPRVQQGCLRTVPLGAHNGPLSGLPPTLGRSNALDGEDVENRLICVRHPRAMASLVSRP
jgi:hypothetical protein